MSIKDMKNFIEELKCLEAEIDKCVELLKTQGGEIKRIDIKLESLSDRYESVVSACARVTQAQVKISSMVTSWNSKYDGIWKAIERLMSKNNNLERKANSTNYDVRRMKLFLDKKLANKPTICNRFKELIKKVTG